MLWHSVYMHSHAVTFKEILLCPKVKRIEQVIWWYEKGPKIGPSLYNYSMFVGFELSSCEHYVGFTIGMC